MKKLLASVLLFFIGYCLQAQPRVIYREQKHLTYSFRYQQAGSAEVNQVLALLAQAQGMRPGSYSEIPLEYDLLKEISRIGKTECIASATFSGIRITRELKNRGFDLSEMLTPVSVKMAIHVPLNLNGDAAPGIRKELVIQNGKTGDASFAFADSGSTNLKVDVTQVEFLFAPNTIGKLRDRLALIQNYYSADATLQQANQTLAMIHPEDINQLDAGLGMLGNVDQQIVSLDIFNFPNQLDLFSTDPVHFVDRLQDLKRRADDMRLRLMNTKANLYIHFYNSGIDFLSRGRKEYARAAFRRSLIENPRFAPAAYQLAEIDYEDGFINESECRVLDIIREMDPDPETRRMTTNLAKSIYENYLSQSERQYQSQHLREAQDYLIKANHLCTSVGGLICDSRIDEGFRKVRTGIYQGFLNDAKSSYQNGDLVQAENILSKAVRFQKDFPDDIPSANEALEMWKGVRQKRYDNLIQEGKALVSERNYNSALKKIEEAYSLQQQFSLIPAKEINELKTNAAKPMILQMIREGLDKASQNDLVGARKISNEAIAFQKKYNLQDDSEVANSLKDLKSGIFSQECQNAQVNYDSMLSGVKNQLILLDYFKADEKIREALKFLEDNVLCSLNDGGIESIRDSILPAVTYQTQIHQVFDYQSQKRYQEMIDRYLEAGSYFIRFSVSEFGLQHAGLDDFAVSKCNNYFLMFLADQYTGKSEFEKALVLYRQLLSRGYSSSNYKAGLERLGIQLGLKEKGITGGKDWKSAVQKYTQGDKRLKYLEKGFKKGWKQS